MKKIFEPVKNKKALFDYVIVDSYDAGIVLTGEEIKSIRNGGAHLTGGYVLLQGTNLFLVGVTIAKYRYSSNPFYDAKRDRLLLLKKSEIDNIKRALQVKGITLIPLEMYLKNNICKLKIGLGKGKKKFDKRETIKERELDRDQHRGLRSI